MSLAINHNMMAASTARNLNAHYGRLSRSVERLSTGLRVNSAADDAAGLAIRELQRADIAGMQQGARNANDAVSMLQTADGALQIIDEKLIRMKELAEQAATGTYDSTQRLMIESEYQAMASEITRIAEATDFNGIHVLDGTLQSDYHDGSGLTSTGKMKIHFGTGNDSSEDYYYIQIHGAQAWNLGPGLGSGSTALQQAQRAARAAYDRSMAIHGEDATVAEADAAAVVAAVRGHIRDE
ncbi:MAG: flagellin, partial [Desulfovibrio sp.]|nr:flagellin [Desulfovibrio sp.]